MPARVVLAMRTDCNFNGDIAVKTNHFSDNLRELVNSIGSIRLNKGILTRNEFVRTQNCWWIFDTREVWSL